MSRITTHVLDTALGLPARNLKVSLAIREPQGDWIQLGEQATNDDGRALDLLHGRALEAGSYRLTFDTGAYLTATWGRAFYPVVEVFFDVDAVDRHHHVPLLLSPYGYSTYRGS